jgi:hypothetical protein
MNFNISLEKKYFFILLGAILILAGAIHGYAQSPAIFGHQFEELEGAQAILQNGNCGVGKVVQSIDSTTGVVTCINDADTDTDTNTNANTECSGTNTYLDGNGNCDSATTIVTNGGGGGAGGLSDCKTITTTYSGVKEKSCSSGYIAVAASCKMGTDMIVNGEYPSAPGSSSGYTQYLIPNVNSATGVHCDTFSSSITSQLHLRCCR